MKARIGALHRLVCILSISCATFVSAASATEHKVQLGAQTIGDYIAAYLAYDEGIFAKHGLDVTLQPITISPLATAGLLSKSMDMATLSTPDMIQAVDSGIDLVAINGIGVLSTEGGTRAGVVATQDVKLEVASDYKGKKVGVPALGGLLHILFQDYLQKNGASPNDVTFIEIAVPSHFDAIKGGSVDAVVTADPMLVRLVNTKTGKQVVSFNGNVPSKTLTSVVVSTRDYAKENPDVVDAVRKAWQEATDLANKNHEKTRAAMVKYLKLPVPVAATIDMPLALEIGVSAEQLRWWQDIMREQKLIEGKSDLSNTIWP